ncbi:Sensor histidine kinase DesK [Streptomyces sp. YIM 130001]|uniref:sensor histidine kinase n=1 Tax=Streptomyces sp. YIM 130001 TaxID=2259644 RepID=UPI000E653530|nr:sensor histidine kinase [Streptomyces sp. YIM 130001]RII17313.1 Sensor histidine kinase DesK [Streptomyces sp. YIM 130001]
MSSEPNPSSTEPSAPGAESAAPAGRTRRRRPLERRRGDGAGKRGPGPGSVDGEHPEPAAGPRLVHLRSALRDLGLALATPAAAGETPFARSPKPWVRNLPYVVVFGFVVALLPVTVTVLVQDYEVNGALAGALATAQAVPLLWALTRPLQAWWVIFAADVLGAFAVFSGTTRDLSWPWTPMVVVGYAVLMILLGMRESRRTLFAVWLATGAAGLVFELVSQERSDGIQLLLFVLSGVLLVVTYALRERGAAERRLVEQETISEAERARRTLLEERTRIARELHDVVAHHMSVITVQADSAPYRIEGIPAAAQEEFTAIAASARESLAEMRRLLAVLRSEDAQGGERTPQPGLDKLQQLVEATVRAGVPAELSLAAELGAVPQAVDLSAYRIVQEALSNVVRHAPGARTRVSVASDGTDLTVLVVNGPPTGRDTPLETAGTGHGLVGMRERVRLTGGSLDVGPLPDGGFRVAARLPLGRNDAPNPEGTP